MYLVKIKQNEFKLTLYLMHKESFTLLHSCKCYVLHSDLNSCGYGGLMWNLINFEVKYKWNKLQIFEKVKWLISITETMVSLYSKFFRLGKQGVCD